MKKPAPASTTTHGASTRGSSRPRTLHSLSSTRNRCRNTTPICRRRSSGRASHRIASRSPNLTRCPTCSCCRRFGCAIGCRCRSDHSSGSRFAFRQPCSRCSPARCHHRRCRSASHRCRSASHRCRSHRQRRLPTCLLRPRRSRPRCQPRRPRFRPIHPRWRGQRHRSLRVGHRQDLQRARPQAMDRRGFRRRYPKWHCTRPARKSLTRRVSGGGERE
jgi:hypothetical protein